MGLCFALLCTEIWNKSLYTQTSLKPNRLYQIRLYQGSLSAKMIDLFTARKVVPSVVISSETPRRFAFNEVQCSGRNYPIYSTKYDCTFYEFSQAYFGYTNFYQTRDFQNPELLAYPKMTLVRITHLQTDQNSNTK